MKRRAVQFASGALQFDLKASIAHGLLMSNRAQNAPARLPGARFEVKNAASVDAADMYIYDDIAWYGVTAQMVATSLNEITAPVINVHINSGGGDIFDGVAIYNLLAQKDAKIVVHVDALAASIASVIAMAGDEIVIAKNAMMMIHRAWGVAIGDEDDMNAMASMLASCEDDQIIPTYVDRTGKSAADLKAMMKAETWMNAQACIDNGFADRIAGASDAKALVRPGLYAKTPKELLAAADWICGATRDLAVDKDSSWDGDGAKERIFEAAGFNGDNPDPSKARPYFLAADASKPKEKGSYKLPFADIKDGKHVAVKAGIDNAAARLAGTEIPESVKKEAQSVIDAYQKKSGEDDKSNSASRKLLLARMKTRTAALSLEV